MFGSVFFSVFFVVFFFLTFTERRICLEQPSTLYSINIFGRGNQACVSPNLNQKELKKYMSFYLKNGSVYI